MKQLFKLQQKIDKLKQQRDKARAEVQRLRKVRNHTKIETTIEPSAHRNITMPSDNFFKIEKFSKFLQDQILKEMPIKPNPKFLIGGVDFAGVGTLSKSAEYGIKEMHIDCSTEEKGFEIGKWYRSRYGITARFERQGIGTGYYSLAWGNWYMQDFKNWQEMTPQEIEEVLTKRCKELGLFDGEFECLTGDNFSNHKGFVEYWEEGDQLWIGRNLAYEKGKFAKLIEKKRILTWDEAPNNIIKIVRNGLDERFHCSHTQLSDKSREYLSQFDNVIIE